MDYLNSQDLIKEIKKWANLFIQEFDDIEEAYKDTRAKDVLRTPAQMLAYIIGWMQLLISWEEKEAKGEVVHTPAPNYNWDNLNLLYEKFYQDYEEYTLEELKEMFRDAENKIIDIVKNLDDTTLFQPGIRAWAKSTSGNWPISKWIHNNTVASYKSFRTRIRRWKKNNEINKSILETALEIGKNQISKGNVATYIPELGKADKNMLGIAIYTADGRHYAIGDTDHRFTIQSISKIISLALVLESFDNKMVFEKVGMEPSGEAFNSLIDLDLNSNKPFNPMINSGALTVASILLEKFTFEEVLEITRKLCMDPDIGFDENVYNSEMNNISRNRAIAYLLESKNIIENDVEETLKLYTKLCSMTVTAKSLANFGMVLANDGVNPETGLRLLSDEAVKIIKTIMLTCGMYDSSGEFAVRVGIPTKSGVGGGLMSAVSHTMGIGIFGPSLDEKGNCIAGNAVLEYLSKKLDLHFLNR